MQVPNLLLGLDKHECNVHLLQCYWKLESTQGKESTKLWQNSEYYTTQWIIMSNGLLEVFLRSIIRHLCK